MLTDITAIFQLSRSLKQKWCWIIPCLPRLEHEYTDFAYLNINEANS